MKVVCHICDRRDIAGTTQTGVFLDITASCRKLADMKQAQP